MKKFLLYRYGRIKKVLLYGEGQGGRGRDRRVRGGEDPTHDRVLAEQLRAGECFALAVGEQHPHCLVRPDKRLAAAKRVGFRRRLSGDVLFSLSRARALSLSLSPSLCAAGGRVASNVRCTSLRRNGKGGGPLSVAPNRHLEPTLVRAGGRADRVLQRTPPTAHCCDRARRAFRPQLQQHLHPPRARVTRAAPRARPPPLPGGGRGG